MIVQLTNESFNMKLNKRNKNLNKIEKKRNCKREKNAQDNFGYKFNN